MCVVEKGSSQFFKIFSATKFVLVSRKSFNFCTNKVYLCVKKEKFKLVIKDNFKFNTVQIYNMYKGIRYG